MKILAISGSTRKKSYNTALLYAFKEIIESNSEKTYADIEVEVFTINDIPIFNQDFEDNLPKVIQDYIEKVRNADAIVISTPEYTNMMPGAVKNALDWLSRSYSKDAIEGKPLAITGTSPSGFGTVLAQNQLLQMTTLLKFKNSPEFRLPISNASNVFDQEGNIIDDEVSEKLKDYANKFIKFAKQ